MRAAYCVEDLLARLQSQVICVVQAKAAARLLELLGCDALQGGLGRHGHEHGQVDRAMWQGEDGGASSGRLSLVRFHVSARIFRVWKGSQCVMREGTSTALQSTLPQDRK